MTLFPNTYYFTAPAGHALHAYAVRVEAASEWQAFALTEGLVPPYCYGGRWYQNPSNPKLAGLPVIGLEEARTIINQNTPKHESDHLSYQRTI